jgi:hypothetical protein
MQFDDFLKIIDNKLKGLNLNKDEELQIYTYSIFKLIRETKIFENYSDFFICSEENLKYKNKLYCSNLSYEVYTNLFDRNDFSKSKFIEKTITEEDKNFLNNLKEIFLKADDIKDISKQISFEDLSKLHYLINLDYNVLTALSLNIEYPENGASSFFKLKQYNKYNLIELAGAKNSDDYNLINRILYNMPKTFEITPVNIHETLVSNSSLINIFALSDFNYSDFSTYELEKFLNKEFLEENPIGLLLNSKTKQELYYNLFDLYYFEIMQQEIIQKIDKFIKKPTLEDILENNKNFKALIDDILDTTIKKYPELLLDISQNIVLDYADLEKNDIYNVKFLIEPFNMINIREEEYRTSGNPLQYFNFKQLNFNMSINPIQVEEDYSSEPLYIVNNDGFVSNLIIGLEKLKFKNSISEIIINDFMDKYNTKQEHIESAFRELFLIAKKENLFVRIRDGLEQQEGVKESYEKIRKEFPEVLSETFDFKYKISNSFINSFNLSYKENILLQNELFKQIDIYKKDIIIESEKSDNEIDLELEKILLNLKMEFIKNKKQNLTI